MSEHALPLELRDPEPLGIWPWVIALVSGVALALSVLERLESIPATLGARAGEVAAGAGATGVGIDVDGRDVTLSGEIPAAVDRDALVDGIAAIEGVRVVRDELDVVDPLARERAGLESFRARLAAIDVSRIAFEPGSASFASGGSDALEALVALMRESPAHRIRVAGHTDSRGRAATNLELSRARAAAVADHLIARGVDSSRVISQGYGATQPVADNATEAGRARNRRIEISYID